MRTMRTRGLWLASLISIAGCTIHSSTSYDSETTSSQPARTAGGSTPASGTASTSTTTSGGSASASTGSSSGSATSQPSSGSTVSSTPAASTPTGSVDAAAAAAAEQAKRDEEAKRAEEAKKKEQNDKAAAAKAEAERKRQERIDAAEAKKKAEAEKAEAAKAEAERKRQERIEAAARKKEEAAAQKAAAAQNSSDGHAQLGSVTNAGSAVAAEPQPGAGSTPSTIHTPHDAVMTDDQHHDKQSAKGRAHMVKLGHPRKPQEARVADKNKQGSGADGVEQLPSTNATKVTRAASVGSAADKVQKLADQQSERQPGAAKTSGSVQGDPSNQVEKIK